MLPQQPRAMRTPSGTGEDLFLTLATDDSREQRPSDTKSIKESKKSRLGFASPKRFSPSKLLSRRNGSETAIPKSTSATSSQIDQHMPDATVTSYFTDPSTVLSPGDKRSRPFYFQTQSSRSEVAGQSSNSYEGNDSSTEAPLAKRRRVPSSSNEIHLKPQTPLIHPAYRTENAPTPPIVANTERALVIAQVDGAASNSSVGASSAVWDELDELKSRIRKLEITGHGSKSNGAEGSFVMVDRPQTAVNTGPPSSFPTRKRAVSPPSQYDSPRSHQLLQSALAKAERQVSRPVYQALDSAISGALELASDLAQGKGDFSDTVSIVSGKTSTDKRLQRKADNLCRNLTDLCIALCESDANDRTVSRAGARDDSISRRSTREHLFTNNPAHNSPLNHVEERRARLDQYQSRPFDALIRAHTSDARHAAQTTRQSHSGYPEDQQTRYRSPSTPRPLHRINTNTNDTRYNNVRDDDDIDPTIRIPSRAMTEINTSSSTTTTAKPPFSNDLHQFSREYTARYPLPNPSPQQQSPSSTQSPSLARNHQPQSPSSATTAAATAMTNSTNNINNHGNNRTLSLTTSSPRGYAASEAGGGGDGGGGFGGGVLGWSGRKGPSGLGKGLTGWGAGSGGKSRGSPSAAGLLADRILERRQASRRESGGGGDA